MATTPNSIIRPQAPIAYTASLAAATACTTRGIIAVGSITSTPAFGVALVPTTTNGVRIDQIRIKAASTAITATSAAQTVLVWYSDGTNCYVFDEILITAIVPSATVASGQWYTQYTNLVLAPTHALYLSTTVTTTASTTALVAVATGSTY